MDAFIGNTLYTISYIVAAEKQKPFLYRVFDSLTHSKSFLFHFDIETHELCVRYATGNTRTRVRVRQQDVETSM